jgi:hypothetical protein
MDDKIINGVDLNPVKIYKMNPHYLTLVSCILFVACHHKPVDISMAIPPTTIEINYNQEALDCTNCTEIPAPQIAHTEIRYWEQQPRFRGGWCLNPNNYQEILYSQIVASNPPLNTFILNWKTQKRTLLWKEMTYGKPSWHPNNWILVSKPGYLYKIKPDGSELTLLNRYKANTGGTWNHAGDRYAFYAESENDELVLADTQSGRALRQVSGEPAFHYFFDWSKPNLFARQRVDGTIVGYNTVDSQRALLYKKTNGSPEGFCWLSDFKTMAVATTSGLYLTNTKTGQVKRLKCCCGTLRYSYPQYAAAVNKLMALKTITYPSDARNLDLIVIEQIVMMNLDGSNGEIIPIPK